MHTNLIKDRNPHIQHPIPLYSHFASHHCLYHIRSSLVSNSAVTTDQDPIRHYAASLRSLLFYCINPSNTSTTPFMRQHTRRLLVISALHGRANSTICKASEKLRDRGAASRDAQVFITENLKTEAVTLNFVLGSHTTWSSCLPCSCTLNHHSPAAHHLLAQRLTPLCNLTVQYSVQWCSHNREREREREREYGENDMCE
ncbi:hypothetical protein E2C01_062665 [Portunus trituberculatus]|uniref:Uncharacterized protein n=1 Tax=Portunus trituberculatus TaxID=210409 RepID=A0A5B7HEA9_PORTR|nr:hypothetical protein [Portunus trituberculatus]